MGFFSSTSKIVIITINIFFWAGTAFLIYTGVAYLRNVDNIVGNVQDFRPAYVTFGLAALLFFCGLIGMAGAFTERKSVLAIFVIIVLLTFALLTTGSTLLFMKHDSAINATNSFFFYQYNNYGSPNLTVGLESDSLFIKATAATERYINGTELIDTIQSNLKCCGWKDYDEWDNYKYWVETLKNTGYIPNSCCNKTYAEANNVTCPYYISIEKEKGLINSNACEVTVGQIVSYGYMFLSWTAVALSIFVLLGLAASVFLFCHKRTSDGFNYSSIVS